MTAPYVKADVRRGQLVTAARQVLRRQGMAGGTLRAVATEAGVPLGTVHYIFPSKEQLLRAVLVSVIDELSDTLRASPRSTTELESAIRSSALGVWSKIVEADPGQQVMQYELTMWALRTPGMADLARWQYDLYLELVTTNWTKAAARAGVTLSVPAERLARLFLAGIDGLILQYLSSGDAERAKADIETLVHHMVAYAVKPAADRLTRGC